MIAKRAVAAVCLSALGGLAHGQSGGGSRSAEYVFMTMAYVQECVQADELLRKTCARIGAHLSDRNKDKCALPSVPFATRTERSYRAFKETYRADIESNEAKLAGFLAETAATFDRQFAQVRAGKISMIDLESLSREVNDRCATVEREWLAPRPRPR